MPARLRILVVEDAEEICETLRAALVNLGHDAEVVGSAEEALEVFDPGSFDLVITDLFLPEMNGDQLARVIKRHDGEMPIILLTAYPPAQTPDGVDNILIKPFGIEQLRHALAKARGKSARISV